MFPWHTNRVFVIGGTLNVGSVFFSITHIIRKVENDFQMSIIRNSLLEFQLRPAELPSRFDVPCSLLESQLHLQNDHILRPADSHGLGQYRRGSFIGAVKHPHPAQVPWGEAGGVRIRGAQILRSGSSGAFLRPAADQPAHFAVQFHLRQICRHQGVQRLEHGAVVYRFSDVHPTSPFRRGCACFYSLGFEIANEQALGSFRGLAP